MSASAYITILNQTFNLSVKVACVIIIYVLEHMCSTGISDQPRNCHKFDFFS